MTGRASSSRPLLPALLLLVTCLRTGARSTDNRSPGNVLFSWGTNQYGKLGHGYEGGKCGFLQPEETRVCENFYNTSECQIAYKMPTDQLCDTYERLSPLHVNMAVSFVKIFVQEYHAYGLTEEGYVYAWGNAVGGRLGTHCMCALPDIIDRPQQIKTWFEYEDTPMEDGSLQSTLVKVLPIPRIKDLFIGPDYVIAMTKYSSDTTGKVHDYPPDSATDVSNWQPDTPRAEEERGELFSWGSGRAQTLGTGSTEDVAQPIKIDAWPYGGTTVKLKTNLPGRLTRVQNVKLGNDFVIALSDYLSLRYLGWHRATYNALTSKWEHSPTSTTEASPIARTPDFADMSGVWSWGRGMSGILANGDQSDSLNARPVCMWWHAHDGGYAGNVDLYATIGCRRGYNDVIDTWIATDSNPETLSGTEASRHLRFPREDYHISVGAASQLYLRDYYAFVITGSAGQGATVIQQQGITMSDGGLYSWGYGSFYQPYGHPDCPRGRCGTGRLGHPDTPEEGSYVLLADGAGSRDDPTSTWRARTTFNAQTLPAKLYVDYIPAQRNFSGIYQSDLAKYNTNLTGVAKVFMADSYAMALAQFDDPTTAANPESNIAPTCSETASSDANTCRKFNPANNIPMYCYCRAAGVTTAPYATGTCNDATYLPGQCIMPEFKHALWSWGAGLHGVLGHGNTFEKLSPRRIIGLPVGVEHVYTKTHTVHVLLRNGNRMECYSWGSGFVGTLGHGNFDDQLVPTRIASFTDPVGFPVRLYVGTEHVIAKVQAADGTHTLFSWGNGYLKVLGHPTESMLASSNLYDHPTLGKAYYNWEDGYILTPTKILHSWTKQTHSSAVGYERTMYPHGQPQMQLSALDNIDCVFQTDRAVFAVRDNTRTEKRSGTFMPAYDAASNPAGERMYSWGKGGTTILGHGPVHAEKGWKHNLLGPPNTDDCTEARWDSSVGGFLKPEFHEDNHGLKSGKNFDQITQCFHDSLHGNDKCGHDILGHLCGGTEGCTRDYLDVYPPDYSVQAKLSGLPSDLTHSECGDDDFSCTGMYLTDVNVPREVQFYNESSPNVYQWNHKEHIKDVKIGKDYVMTLTCTDSSHEYDDVDEVSASLQSCDCECDAEASLLCNPKSDPAEYEDELSNNAANNLQRLTSLAQDPDRIDYSQDDQCFKTFTAEEIYHGKVPDAQTPYCG